MSKNNLGPGFKRFELKSGFDSLRWGGAFTEGDPSSVPRGRLRLLVNGRFYGGEIVERPGTGSFVDLGDATACISFLDDYQIARPLKLWIIGDGCPGVSSTAGFFMAMLDQEQSPEFQRAIYFSGGATALKMAVFNEAVHVGLDSALRKLQFIRQPYGTEAIALGGTSQDSPISTFSGFTIRCMQAFDGKLFIGLDGGAGASKIVTWDGISIRNDLTGIDPPKTFGLYHAPKGGDSLVVGFASATNHIRYRVTGDSPGTWATIVPTAGGPFGSVSMAAYKDKLYIATGSTSIWVYDADAATLALAHSPASATSVNAVCTFNSLLYFGYETNATLSLSAGRIGKYDGTTWTDTEKDLAVQLSCNAVRALADYRGALWAGGLKSGSGGRLYQSPATTTTGTYVEVIPNANNNGDIEALMVA